MTVWDSLYPELHPYRHHSSSSRNLWDLSRLSNPTSSPSPSSAATRHRSPSPSPATDHHRSRSPPTRHRHSHPSSPPPSPPGTRHSSGSSISASYPTSSSPARLMVTFNTADPSPSQTPSHCPASPSISNLRRLATTSSSTTSLLPASVVMPSATVNCRVPACPLRNIVAILDVNLYHHSTFVAIREFSFVPIMPFVFRHHTISFPLHYHVRLPHSLPTSPAANTTFYFLQSHLHGLPRYPPTSSDTVTIHHSEFIPLLRFLYSLVCDPSDTTSPHSLGVKGMHKIQQLNLPFDAIDLNAFSCPRFPQTAKTDPWSPLSCHHHLPLISSPRTHPCTSVRASFYADFVRHRLPSDLSAPLLSIPPLTAPCGTAIPLPTSLPRSPITHIPSAFLL